MAGIYFHIPFCKKACSYCDFHFSTSLNRKEEMVQALLLELSTRAKTLHQVEEITSIYFGGGTPSLLDTEEIKQLLDAVYRLFRVKNGIEITLEANPDDLTLEKLTEFKLGGINRLSIGIQSFYEADLKLMNRIHTSQQASDCVKNAQNVGINNISIDLIYGVPNASFEQWQDNVKRALALNIQHISAYCLTVEPKTLLQHLVVKGKMNEAKEEDVEQQFHYLIDTLAENGYEQYEISNFALKDCYAQHNSSYWLGKKYWGIGPSAHSFDGTSRRWNVANNAQYIKKVNQDEDYFEVEDLNNVDQFNEYLMTSLRTVWGVSFDYVQNRFGIEYLLYLKKSIVSFTESEDVVLGENGIVLSQQGKLITDHILRELFLLEPPKG